VVTYEVLHDGYGALRKSQLSAYGRRDGSSSCRLHVDLVGQQGQHGARAFMIARPRAVAGRVEGNRTLSVRMKRPGLAVEVEADLLAQAILSNAASISAAALARPAVRLRSTRRLLWPASAGRKFLAGPRRATLGGAEELILANGFSSKWQWRRAGEHAAPRRRNVLVWPMGWKLSLKALNLRMSVWPRANRTMNKTMRRVIMSEYVSSQRSDWPSRVPRFAFGGPRHLRPPPSSWRPRGFLALLVRSARGRKVAAARQTLGLPPLVWPDALQEQFHPPYLDLAGRFNLLDNGSQRRWLHDPQRVAVKARRSSSQGRRVTGSAARAGGHHGAMMPMSGRTRPCRRSTSLRYVAGLHGVDVLFQDVRISRGRASTAISIPLRRKCRRSDGPPLLGQQPWRGFFGKRDHYGRQHRRVVSPSP